MQIYPVDGRVVTLFFHLAYIGLQLPIAHLLRFSDHFGQIGGNEIEGFIHGLDIGNLEITCRFIPRMLDQCRKEPHLVLKYTLFSVDFAYQPEAFVEETYRNTVYMVLYRVIVGNVGDSPVAYYPDVLLL